MKNYSLFRGLTFAALSMLLTAAPASAQQGNGSYDLSSYPDVGQDNGLVWNYRNFENNPVLAFEVPETDNQLWTMDCEKQPDGSVRIANLLIATPPGLRASDQFGFTIRVDDSASVGIWARMLPVRLEGDPYHMPQFYLPNRHALFPALARGNRAYVDLGGNKFSVSLKGSGEALKSFLRACQ